MIVVVNGMHGLGDSILSRAFIKTLSRDADVYYRTPWPEIVEDVPRVSCLYHDSPLRTQRKNVQRQREWVKSPPSVDRKILVSYASTLRSTMVQSMQACFGVAPSEWDLPADLPPFASPDGRLVAVVRPVTERYEWRNTARNPLPQYVAHVAADLMNTHYVVSVADLEKRKEWLVGEPPPAHLQLHNGELAVRELLGLVQAADVVVGGVGWIVPACIASGTPLFCILGGHGQNNAPEKITDKRMRLDDVCFAFPDRFCRCSDMRHGCDKKNSRLSEQWASFWSERRCMGHSAPVVGVAP